MDHIQDRVPIDRRPAYIHKRRKPDIGKADLMLFAQIRSGSSGYS